MASPPENDRPADLAAEVDAALEAAWRGDGTRFDRLLDATSDGTSGPSVGEMLDPLCHPPAEPVVGLAAGTEVRGYRIIGEIGRGGMGVVYEAEQQEPRRRVALKVLRRLDTDEYHVKLFRREIQSLARLSHPTVATIYEAGRTTEGQYFFTMERISGPPLDLYVREHNLTLHARLELLLRIAEGVHYAHRQGVVHRDLKPSNIVIDAEGHPKILDFGLARLADPDQSLAAVTTEPGRMLGTLAYMSPEQVNGRPDETDARSDVYALGVVLYELLTGRLPYVLAQRRPHEVARAICEQDPRPPGTIDRQLRGDLETIMTKALAKVRTRRYQTAAELAEDIRRYLRGDPILARRPSRLYLVRKRLIRHRVVVAAVLVAGTFGLIGLWGGVWSKDRALERAQARELAAARQAALSTLGELEDGTRRIEELLAGAELAWKRHAELPEVQLAWARTRYRAALELGDNALIDQVVDRLADGMLNSAAPWACRALLSEIRPQAIFLQTVPVREPPDTAEAWYLRSFATLDIQRARDCALEALQRDPEHLLARERLAHLHLRAGDGNLALGAAQELIDRGCNPIAWLQFQGRALLRMGRHQEAYEHLRRAAELDPTSPSPHRLRGLAHLCLREYEQSIEDYTTAAGLHNPPSLWECYQRATPLWITGRTSEAAEDYQFARERRGHVSLADVRLVLVLQDQARRCRSAGRPEEAERSLLRAQEVLAVARREASPGSWCARILACLAGAGSPDELVQSINPDGPARACEAYYYAGEACLLRDDTPSACLWFQRCVDTGIVLDPNSNCTDPMNEYHLALWRLDLCASEQAALPGN